MYELGRANILKDVDTAHAYILFHMFQSFDFDNKKYEKARATCQFYEGDEQVSLQQIEKDMVHYRVESAFDVFVVNNELFGSNEKFQVARHEPYSHITMTNPLLPYECEELAQSSFDALHIDKTFWSDNWSSTTKKGGVIRIKVKQRLVIGKEGSINVSGHGCGDGHGFGATSVGDAGAGYSTKGEDSWLEGGGGQAYGDKELSVLHYGSSDADGNRAGGIIELIAENIINYGSIHACPKRDSYASGGSTKIQCKTFVNKGSGNILATSGYYGGAHGRIAIFCEQYKNEGLIKPQPFVKIMKYDENAQYTPIESP